MVEGELRGRLWKSWKEPKRGQLAGGAGWQNENKARPMVEKFCEKFGKFSIEELEADIREKCKKVYAEAVADAGGQKPLYLRVDMLLDKQGRVWLNERESWGADVNSCVHEDWVGRELPEKKGRILDPSYKELSVRMVNRTKDNLRELRSRRLSSSSRSS